VVDWFVGWSAASGLVHRWLRGRAAAWLRVLAFVVPPVLGLGAAFAWLVFLGLATLC
jgi:hypothetical protein